MQVGWEAVTAMASMLSSIAVLLAVVIAVRQVRVGAAQVDALRRATQLEGTMKIFEMLSAPEIGTGLRFIANELPQRFRDDPVYREELLSLTRFREHAEAAPMRLMEVLGIYVKHGILDQDVLFEFWIPGITDAWDTLVSLGVVTAHRERVDRALWINFEHLVARYKAYDAANALNLPPRRPPPAATADVADAPTS
jgi:hypothetical protein